MLRPVGYGDCSISVPKRPAIHVDSLPPHSRELMGPEEMPAGVIVGSRNPCVEADLSQLPFPLIADSLCECRNIIIGVGIPERISNRVKEVLPVHEDGRTLDWWWARQGLFAKK